jgi:hypothetical protein
MNQNLKIKTPKSCRLTLLVMLLALCSSALAQQPSKIFRIGFISPASSKTAGPNLEALRQGLQQLGYFEGKNITLEAR